MAHWQITEALSGTAKCRKLLAEGWEPYAVTGANHRLGPAVIYFRRLTG